MKFLADVLLLVPLVLIAIGDGVLFLLKLSFIASVKFLRTLKKFSLPRIVFPHVAFDVPTIHIPKLPKLQMLKKRGISKKGRIFPPPLSFSDKTRWFVAGVLFCFIFLFIPYSSWFWLRNLPNPKLLTRRDIAVATKIFDRNGVLLYEIYADQNRTPVPLSDIPKTVQNATIAIEDKDFYLHNGISLRGILRALRELLLHKTIQGGSTITQQLVKSALLTPEITLSRKMKEMVLAFWAERLYSKKQILEMYLNQVPYGGTAWGIEAASQMYFGKSTKDVTLAEAALLAGLPAAPTAYSPYSAGSEKAFARQREVLRRMEEDHYITKEEAEAALVSEVHIRPPGNGLRAPHFVMYVKELLEARYGSRLVQQGGLRVKTSLDVTTQEMAEYIVRTHIDSLSALRVGNGAALVTNPKTGEILAMVGSRDYFDLSRQGNVNVTTSLQQPGSAIKVVTYATALENGFTASSILDDSPVTFRGTGSPNYTPVNYDGRFHGFVPLRYALGNSYNVPAVKTLAKIGVAAMIEKGRLMGIDTWRDENRYGLSLTLGGGEVTMLNMAEVFGTLANGGFRADLQPILEVTDYTGRVLERNRTKNGFAAVRPEVAWILTNILSDNTARTSAFGPNSLLVILGKSVSVKTGTSNDKRDNWTIGYTPSFVVTVWVGNNDNTPMHPTLTSGVTGAAPIWHDIMGNLLKDKPDEPFIMPQNIVSIPCYFGRTEYFIKGTEPAGGQCAPLPTQSPSPSPSPSP